MKRAFLRWLCKMRPVRWIYMDYTMFRSKYKLARVRGDLQARIVAQNWVNVHADGEAVVCKSRPKWSKTGQFVEMVGN